MVSRRVIERDNYTCLSPGCLQGGRLEADHIELRPRQRDVTPCDGPQVHEAPGQDSRSVRGAPKNITVRMASRTYRNDELIHAFQRRELGEDPWAIGETRHKPEPWTVGETEAAYGLASVSYTEHRGLATPPWKGARG